MTFSGTSAEYWPFMLVSLKGTGTMISISTAICLLTGLPLGLELFLTNPKVKGYQPRLYRVLNFIVTAIRSFPYLLFVIVLIPVTRFVSGGAFDPTPSSVPLSIAAIAIFARLVERVLLDISEEIYFLTNSLGTSEVQYVWHFSSVEARSGLVPTHTTTTMNMVPYSAVVDIVGGGGTGDFVARVEYRRYECSIMYVVIVIMIALVFILQMPRDFITQRLDKRK